MKKTTAAILIAVLLGGCNKGQETKEPSSLFSDSDLAVSETKPVAKKVEAKAVATAEPALRKVSSKVPQYLARTKGLSYKLFEQGKYYESVVAEVEGYRETPYHDNIGIAIGFGWNVSYQSVQTNQKLSQAAGLPMDQAVALTALSGKFNVTSLPAVHLSEEQATKAATAMRPQFEAPLSKWIPEYSKLADHQKAVLAYHVEKVGPGGAAKYKGLYAAVNAYIKNPTEAAAKAVGEHITYSYMWKGQRVQDHRSQLYMAALFLSPEAYGYLLGKNAAPAPFTQVAKSIAPTLDTSKAAEDQIDYSFEEIREKAATAGVDLQMNEPEPEKGKDKYSSDFRAKMQAINF